MNNPEGIKALVADDFAHGIAFIKTHREALLKLAGSVSERFVVERTIESLTAVAGDAEVVEVPFGKDCECPPEFRKPEMTAEEKAVKIRDLQAKLTKACRDETTPTRQAVEGMGEWCERTVLPILDAAAGNVAVSMAAGQAARELRAMLAAAAPQAGKGCDCRTCRPQTVSDMRMILCAICGNKRCPHANDHRNACTNSNESGQPGSAYPATPTPDASGKGDGK